MKVARVEVDGAARVALVDGDELQLLDDGADVIAVLSDPSAARRSGEALPLDAARLLPPVEPPSVRDFLTFEQHVTAMVKLHQPPRAVAPEWYDAPTFYFSNPAALVGAHDDVEVPPGCSVLDYELELACVIGRDGARRRAGGGVARTSPATRSSTTGRRATCSSPRCRSGSARRRARTRRSRSARGS